MSTIDLQAITQRRIARLREAKSKWRLRKWIIVLGALGWFSLFVGIFESELIAMMGMGAVLGYGKIKMYQHERRILGLEQESAEEIIARQTQAGKSWVLYLRASASEAIGENSRISRAVRDSASPDWNVAQTILESINGRLPVICLPNPHLGPVPGVHVAEFPVDWKSHVEYLSVGAAAVIVHLGALSRAVVWELDMLKRLDLLKKSILVFPENIMVPKKFMRREGAQGSNDQLVTDSVLSTSSEGVTLHLNREMVAGEVHETDVDFVAHLRSALDSLLDGKREIG